MTTSTRSNGRSLGAQLLVDGVDRMNDSPHGASVVPRVAVTMAIASPVNLVLVGNERAVQRRAPVRFGQQAGGHVGQEHRRQQQQECSTRLKLPRSTSSETVTAAGTLM